MNVLRSFVDFEDPAFSRAAAFATAAAVMATVPLACIAYVLQQATIAMPSRATIVDVTAIVVAAIVVQIPLATAGARALRASLDRNAERLRIRTVEHLRKVPARTLASLEPGQVLSTMTNGLDDATAIVAEGFTGIFGGLLKAAGAIAIVAVIDWRIAGFALVFFPLVAAYVRQSRIVSARATPRLVRAQAEGVARFYEYVESIALLRAFGCTAERLRRLGLAVSELNVKAFENTVAPMTFGVVALFFVEFAFAITLTIGVEINGNSVGVRYIIAFTVALAYFQTIFEALDGYLRLRNAASHLRGVAWLLALPASQAQVTAVPERHDLALDRVAFEYDRGPVLRDVTFAFPERGVTAIVGASGAGKSALAHVIAGIWEASEGGVFVGGTDIGTLVQEARARTVSIVFQDTHLFEESIAKNIAAGRPQATAAEVLEAGRIAGCDDFALRLPQGYDTVIRSAGTNLSLGERQRIAIARMLLAEAPIVVLDECTASLDASSERAVHRAIAALADRKTVVLITHRLGTVRNAAQIVVMAHGAIVEAGTHEQLLARPGEYARLWRAHERLNHWKVAS